MSRPRAGPLAAAGALLALAAFAPGVRADPAAADPGADPLAELRSRAEALDLARDPGWLRLGHWRPRLGGGVRSEVDGKGFFLAARGREDPRAELMATLAALFDPAPRADELDAARCRFPARLLFLEARLGLDPARLPPRACPRRDDFLGRVRPVGATLVFSSYYLNNPSSAFGHTLLRLDQAPAPAGRQELLDYGVDYAATTDTSNAVLYALKGLFGRFPGQFKAYAYYYKVRQYADAESRDLWEYRLALTPGEVALLAAHVWELGGTTLSYWYLDRNCSYEVLAALEAAAPRLRLLEHVGPFVVLPSDTVHALFENPGLVAGVAYRPSARTQFVARARALAPGDAPRVAALAGDAQAPLPARLPAARQAAVLDAALDLVDLRHARGLLFGTDRAAARLRQGLLARRAALGITSPPFVVEPPEAARPDRGHGAVRLGLGAGSAAGEGALLLQARLALHDLADPAVGFPADMQIEFLPVRLRYLPRPRRLELEDASLVQITSINPVSAFDLRPSWRARLGATSPRDAGCAGCTAFVAEVGGGFAAGRLLDHLDLLALGDVELLAAPGLRGAGGSGWRPGVGPSLLARLRVGGGAVALAEARWRALPFARPRSTWQLAATLRLHLTAAASLGLEARRGPGGTDLSAVALGYF